jgi:hypothetical protein
MQGRCGGRTSVNTISLGSGEYDGNTEAADETSKNYSVRGTLMVNVDGPAKSIICM